MEDRYQKELFEDLDKTKRQSLKIDNIGQKTKFSLTMSLEKLVFSSIAVVMAMVVIYAIGIEKGKVLQRDFPQQHISRSINSVTVGGVKAKVLPKAVIEAAPKVAPQVAPSSVPQAAVQPAVMEKKAQAEMPIIAPRPQQVTTAVVESQHIAPVKTELIPIKALPLSAQPKPYTIVGATFTRKDWADKEIEKLKKSGQEAVVYQSANYFLVCIGSYETKDEAKSALIKIRNTYKDAYLRSR